MEPGETTAKRTRPGLARSPNYPGVSLEHAIERARVLYRHEGRNAAPVSAILAHWGHKPGSGQGLVNVAALKKFGLLQDEGHGNGRQARLTADALAIILDERPDSAERIQLIQRAALRPPIHQELWEEYQTNLPSDATLKFKLQNGKHFTEGGATDFIGQLRATYAFAFPDGTAMVTGTESGPPQEEPMPVTTSTTAPTAAAAATAAATPPSQGNPAPAPNGMRSIQLPVGSAWATLQAAFPMSEADWLLMIGVLTAMKPGLVRKDDSSGS
jgi:hypothetical protein